MYILYLYIYPHRKYNNNNQKKRGYRIERLEDQVSHTVIKAGWGLRHGSEWNKIRESRNKVNTKDTYKHTHEY